MKLFFYVLVLLGLGFPIFAQAGPAICIFSKECFEDEACTKTDMRLLLDTTEDNPDSLNLITDSETLPAEVVLLNDTEGHIMAKGESAIHLLSWKYKRSEARYTVHMAGPLVVTYLGGCGATP